MTERKGWGAVAAALEGETHPAPAGWDRVRAALGGTAPGEPTDPVRPEPVVEEPAVAEAQPEPASADAEGDAVTAAPPEARGNRRRLVAAGGAVAVVGAAVAAAIVHVSGGGGLPADVAFTVNGHAVTLSQFNAELGVRQTLYGIQPPAQSDKAATSKYLQSAAQAEAVSTLLDQLAPKQGVDVSASQAQQKLDSAITTQYGGQSSFAAALAAANLNESQVLTEVQHNLEYQQLFAKVVGTPAITDAQVQQWFGAHTAQLAIPETRQLSHIVTASQADATSMLAQLQGGASFATLAAKSLDTSTAANGGQLGLYAKDDLKPAFADAAFAATVNVPFGPVAETSGTSTTYEIGLVTAIHPAAPASLTPTVSAAIKTVLTDQAEADAWDAWLGGQLRRASIRYAAAYRPAHPDAPPVIPVPNLTGETLAGVGAAASTPGSGPQSTTPSTTVAPPGG